MSSPDFSIGLVQFDLSWEDPGENMQRIEHLLNPYQGFDLILLPEMWSTGFTMQPEIVAEATPGPALNWMRCKSTEYNSVIAGSLSVKENSAYFNRWYCVFPDGRTVSYDKKHLFSYGKEDQHYTAGKSRVSVDIKGWKIRPVICYDIRFPVWCRNTDDYDVMVVVANWPSARIHHWDALLKARAIENQCYVAAVNRVGRDGNGLQYNGHSCIFDMNGQLVMTLEEKEAVGTFSLSKGQLVQFREQFRFLQDRDSFSV